MAALSFSQALGRAPAHLKFLPFFLLKFSNLIISNFIKKYKIHLL